MEQQGAVSGVRYRLIDALRGLSLLNMLAYHFLYDIIVIYGRDARWALQPAVVAWERYICCSFILIAGISLNFSRHAWRHGVLVSVCGIVITAVTAIAIPGQVIVFGVLTFIGAAILLVQALRRLLERCNPFTGAAVSLLLFAFFYGMPVAHTVGFFDVPLLRLPDALYRFRPLAAVGLPDAGFYSTDYFPLIPWLFLFACGFFGWRALVSLNADRFFVRGVPLLDVVGKYTLWIYLIHQPLLMGVCFLMFGGF